MMKFKLYQIQLTDAEIATVNELGHSSVPKQRVRLDLQMPGVDDPTTLANGAWAAGYYDHVANITAADLDGVFHTGNVGPEDRIERLAQMSSVSVGDLIVAENGERHVVASFGFKEIF